jgi:cytochrome c
VCTNCHAFNAPLIGPSLNEIAKRYPQTRANESLLAQRLVNGSSGVWGSAVMPSHPDLTAEEAQQIVRWILANAKNPRLAFYPNAEGAFKLIEPEGVRPGGAFVLRASYTDHGAADGKPAQGADVVVVNAK